VPPTVPQSVVARRLKFFEIFAACFAAAARAMTAWTRLYARQYAASSLRTPSAVLHLSRASPSVVLSWPKCVSTRQRTPYNSATASRG
jgi:hypothetical protein